MALSSIFKFDLDLLSLIQQWIGVLFRSLATCVKYRHDLIKDSGVWKQKQCKGQALFVPKITRILLRPWQHTCEASSALSNRNIFFLLWNQICLQRHGITSMSISSFNISTMIIPEDTDYIFNIWVCRFLVFRMFVWGNINVRMRQFGWNTPLIFFQKYLMSSKRRLGYSHCYVELV